MAKETRGESSQRPQQAPTVVETSVESDMLLYDSATHQAFRLNEAAATIWHRCDGTTSVEDITEGDMERWQLLARLAADGLVSGVPAQPPKRAVTRRAFVRAGAAVTVGAAMTPIIEGIIVPTSAAAASGQPGGTGIGNGGPTGGDPGPILQPDSQPHPDTWVGKFNAFQWSVKGPATTPPAWRGTVGTNSSNVSSWTASPDGHGGWFGTYTTPYTHTTFNWTAAMNGNTWTVTFAGTPATAATLQGFLAAALNFLSLH